LTARRTADYKEIRNYGDGDGDLGLVKDYQAFLGQLQQVFARVYQVLKPGAYCCVVVMDIRKKNRFYPFHSDLAGRLQDLGFVYDDLLIWDRRQEYNNMRPLGYPAVFRVNKVHEFILIFQKPAESPR
jgi:DNA modification methylase